MLFCNPSRFGSRGEVGGNRRSNCLLERPDASVVVMMRSALEPAATESQPTSRNPSPRADHWAAWPAIATLAIALVVAARRRPRTAVSILVAVLLPVLLWKPITWTADYVHLALTVWAGAGQLGETSRPHGSPFAIYDWSVGFAGGQTNSSSTMRPMRSLFRPSCTNNQSRSNGDSPTLVTARSRICSTTITFARSDARRSGPLMTWADGELYRQLPGHTDLPSSL